MNLVKKMKRIIESDNKKVGSKEEAMIILDGEGLIDVLEKFKQIREELEEKNDLTKKGSDILETWAEKMIEELSEQMQENKEDIEDFIEYAEDELEDIRETK